MVERRALNAVVVGSSPASRSISSRDRYARHDGSDKILRLSVTLTLGSIRE